MHEIVECKVCDNGYAHHLTTIGFGGGSEHLLFLCEKGHFFHLSSNEHKENTQIDKNKTMDELCEFLNEYTSNHDGEAYSLLELIDTFLSPSLNQ